MIFILLGIIILVVSFLVALASLVREQAKFEREVTFDKDAGNSNQVGLQNNQTLPAQPMPPQATMQSQKVKDQLLVSVDEQPEEDRTRRPFWEELSKNQQTPGQDYQSQQAIEEIQARLATIKRQKETQTLAKSTDSQNFDDDRQNKLSGEISISQLAELRKSNS